jgi:hypothetical protein
MKKLIDVLKESRGQKFEYGGVMLYFTFPEITKIHEMMDPDDIYYEEGDRSFGLEDEPHTTLLFGLHEGVTSEDVSGVLIILNSVPVVLVTRHYSKIPNTMF